MNTITISQKEYKTLKEKSVRYERIKKIFPLYFSNEEELAIRPSVLKRWERISRDLDLGKGASFASIKNMKQWLKNL